MGGSDTAVVLEVHTSQEPHMSSQLVLDGNPVECTAHYEALCVIFLLFQACLLLQLKVGQRL